MFGHDLLAERARVTPNSVAVISIETGERLTYAELNERAERAAATLRSMLDPGDRFGILAHNSIEFLELFFAAGKAGVIVVPLSTRATAHELGMVVSDCAMKALFYGAEFEAIAAQLNVPVTELLGSWAKASSNPATEQPSNPSRNPEQPYCLLYTSGTTGKPKGVIIPKRQLYCNGYNTSINWGLLDDYGSPIFTPL